MSTARGTWSHVFTGKKFYLKTCRPNEVDIRDIAHALSLQCRFTGHVRKFYSVAQHCVHVSELCDRVDAPWGLLHDAAEAYMGDVSRQIKHSDEMKEYRRWEQRTLNVIATRFGLQGEEPPSVLRVDKVMLSLESDQLLNETLTVDWKKWHRMHDVYICSHSNVALPVLSNPWSPELAEQRFLERFHFLFGE